MVYEKFYNPFLIIGKKKYCGKRDNIKNEYVGMLVKGTKNI